MQQRYYDPLAGRFLSVDPVAASVTSFNRYWYGNNNPYKNIDPDGRKACGKNTTCSLANGARGGVVYRHSGSKTPTSDRNNNQPKSKNQASNMDSDAAPSGSECNSGKALCYGSEVDQAKKAIEKYNIVGFGYSVCYASCQKADGQVTPSGYVILGPSAFKSESWLAATLGHEIVAHWEQQMKILGPWKDWAEYHARERGAYDYNIGAARSFGNSDEEIAEFVRRRNEH